MMYRTLKNILLRNDGNVVIEAALILPFLISAGLGAADASYMLLQNHRAESQLTIAATYMSKAHYPQNVENQAKNLAVTGVIGSGGTPLIAGWSSQDINIAYKTVDNTSGSYLGGGSVKVVQISTEIPYSGLGIVNSITRNSIKIKVTVEERLSSVLMS